MLRLIENISTGWGPLDIEPSRCTVQVSPQAQRIMIEREMDIEFKKKLARVLAGIEKDE